MHSSTRQLIDRRYSCRTYLEEPIDADRQRLLTEYLGSLGDAPLGSRARFALVAATEHDRDSLKGLGTYGFIKDATGFIVGAVERGRKTWRTTATCWSRSSSCATDLGLGTCWLGGTFTKSSFANRSRCARDETMPAVWRSAGSPIGHAGSGAHPPSACAAAGAARRAPLLPRRIRNAAAEHGRRRRVYRRPCWKWCAWAPSATNKQPWRIVRMATTGISTCSARRATARAACSSPAAHRRSAARRHGHRHVPLRTGRPRARAVGCLGARRAGPAAAQRRRVHGNVEGRAGELTAASAAEAGISFSVSSQLKFIVLSS